MSDEEILTFAQAAVLLKVKPQTIYVWKNKGKINATKEKRWMVKKTEIEKFQKESSAKGQ